MHETRILYRYRIKNIDMKEFHIVTVTKVSMYRISVLIISISLPYRNFGISYRTSVRYTEIIYHF